MVHYAAKAQGLLSFGMFRTTADYQDEGSIFRSAREAKRFGFDGASCVHPSVVVLLNTAFKPSLEEISWAERVLARANDTPKGAFSFEGKMVDAPILARACRILGY
jgi:citrate lyase subunit beta/citryl-CoA lyase